MPLTIIDHGGALRNTLDALLRCTTVQEIQELRDTQGVSNLPVSFEFGPEISHHVGFLTRCHHLYRGAYTLTTAMRSDGGSMIDAQKARDHFVKGIHRHIESVVRDTPDGATSFIWVSERYQGDSTEGMLAIKDHLFVSTTTTSSFHPSSLNPDVKYWIVKVHMKVKAFPINQDSIARFSQIYANMPNLKWHGSYQHPEEERILAAASASHSRLGENSPLHKLDPILMDNILKDVRDRKHMATTDIIHMLQMQQQQAAGTTANSVIVCQRCQGLIQ